MSKNFWIVFLAGAAVVLGLVVVRQNRRVEASEKAVRAAQAAVKAAAQAPVEAKRAETSRPQEAVRQAAEDDMAAAPAEVVAEPRGPVREKTPVLGTNFMGAVAEMMKNPQMKEMMRAQQKVAMGQMYGGLSRYLSLTGERKEQLDELLLDRQMALAEMGLAMMSGDKEDMATRGEEVAAVQKEYDAAIKALLGDDDYEIFKHYEESIPEQMSVSMFKNSLTGDNALSEQQEYDLIAALYDARKALPAESLLNQQNSQTPDPSMFSEERIAEAMRQLETSQKAAAERAGTILGAAQMEQFKTWQKQMADMQRLGLNMAAQMFGQGQPPGGAAK